jgi:hypothetical protein
MPFITKFELSKKRTIILLIFILKDVKFVFISVTIKVAVAIVVKSLN